MKRDNVNYAAVGAFVLLMLAGALVALLLVSGRSGPTDEYSVRYGNVAGIKFGTPVYYEGYPVGQVESVEPLRGERGISYRVRFSVIQGWAIPADSLAAVVSSGLLAQVSINISEGASETLAPPGSELAGSEDTGLFAAVNSVADEMKSVIQEGVRPLLVRIQSSVERFAGALDSTAPRLLDNLDGVGSSAGDHVPAILDRLDRVSQRLDQEVPKILADVRAVTGGLREATPEVTATVSLGAGRVRRLLSEENLAQVEAVLTDLEVAAGDARRLGGQVQSTAQAVAELVARLDRLVAEGGPEARAALAGVRQTVDQLAGYVDTIGYNLESASRHMNEASRQIRQSPSMLLLSAPARDQ